MGVFIMLNFDDKTVKLVNKCEKEVVNEFNKIDLLEEFFSLKVLKAFNDEKVSTSDFNSSTGYGYGDSGRDKIERIFAEVLGTEDALVRNQFISGSHALNVTFFGLLRPGDLLFSISGLPYDTLHEVIGIKENSSSLKSFGIKYDQIDLIDNDFDYGGIKDYLINNKVSVIEIQRSKGYSTRNSITIDKVKRVCDLIKEVSPITIIMVDNCYCEFVETKSPIEVGADIIVESLIKNLGSGLALNGAYVAGSKELVNLVAESLTLPGEGKEVGPSLGVNRYILQGLYMAPFVVASSLKVAILTSKVFEELGVEVEPRFNEKRADIVQSIIFKDEKKLVKYTQGIQTASAIDSFAIPMPWDMPGYDDKVIMASGSFVDGSSIEISCDAPIREPYIAYQQGSLSYRYGKIALIKAISYMNE
jgi:cystathionine beta-lyase family protein involved in aluminum resistance